MLYWIQINTLYVCLQYCWTKSVVFNDLPHVIQGCEMVKSPQILILLLKRFDFDFHTMSHFKSDCCVEVPCALQREARGRNFEWYFLCLLLKSFHVADCVLHCRRRRTNCTGWWITWAVYTVDITHPSCPMRTKPGMSSMTLTSKRWELIEHISMAHIQNTEKINIKEIFVECSFCFCWILQVRDQPFAKTRTYKYVQLFPLYQLWHGWKNNPTTVAVPELLIISYSLHQQMEFAQISHNCRSSIYPFLEHFKDFNPIS